MERIGFEAFLRRTGNERLLSCMRSIDTIEPIPRDIAATLAHLVRIHMATGGTEEAVEAWIHFGDLGEVDRVIDAMIDSLVKAYADETGLDAKTSATLWRMLPAQMARENTRYHHTRPKDDAQGHSCEDLMLHLEHLGLVRKVRRLERPEFPMEPHIYHSQYKFYLADTGLYRRLARLPFSTVDAENPRLSRFRGILTESYALDALLRMSDGSACYWKSGNTAEVDFVIPLDGKIIPVEVKTARNVKSHSLALYRQLYAPPVAVRASLLNLKHDDDLLNIPLYLLEMAPGLIRLARRDDLEAAGNP